MGGIIYLQNLLNLLDLLKPDLDSKSQYSMRSEVLAEKFPSTPHALPWDIRPCKK
jgi:hypothetical protein